MEGELISEKGNELQILGPWPFNHMNKSFWASPREVFTLAVMQSKIKLQTIQYRKSRIQEIKEDKYAKGLAKNQVCAIFHMRDIRKNVLPKFIKLCMETPCLCPFQGHKYGCRKPTETSVFEFSYQCVNSSLVKVIKD